MTKDFEMEVFLPAFKDAVVRHVEMFVSDEKFNIFRRSCSSKDIFSEESLLNDGKTSMKAAVVRSFSSICYTGYRDFLRNIFNSGNTFEIAGVLHGNPILFCAEYGVYCWSVYPDGDVFFELSLSYPARALPNFGDVFASEFENMAQKHYASLFDSGVSSEKNRRMRVFVDESIVMREIISDILLSYENKKSSFVLVGWLCGEPVYFIPEVSRYFWTPYTQEFYTRSV